MYQLREDRLFIDGSDEERRLVVSFNDLLSCHWKDGADDGVRHLVFDHPFALLNFYEQMNRMSERGFLFGALLFSRRALEVERQVRSHILTKLVRSQYDRTEAARPIRESEVSHAATFVNALISDLTEVIFEWSEDMNTDDPHHDLVSQPTAVIRGTLFSGNIDQRKACRFWELAAASPRFPDRIFCDPCPPANGSIFMPYHFRVIGRIMMVVSETAAQRFATVIVERAVNKGILLSEDDGRVHRIVIVPASDHERRQIMENILNHIDDHERRQMVTGIFSRFH